LHHEKIYLASTNFEKKDYTEPSMKNIRSITSCLFFAILALGSQSQNGVEKSVIATLGPDEALAHGEDCFILGRNPESISFVTVVTNGSEKQYYCYGKDRIKSGPFKSPDPSYWKDCSDKVTDNCMVNNDANMTGFEKYLSPDGAITYEGKKYGPYGQVILYNMSADQKGIFAIALSSEMKLIFFDNTGRKVDITGMPDQIIISPDGKSSYVKVNGTLNPFDPEALQKMVNDPEETNNPKIFLYSINGSKYGPYNSSSFTDTWFTPSGQWIIFANSEVYLNGKILFKPVDYVSKCDIWINKTSEDYAYANYEKIIFKNGTSFTAPLAIEQVTENGKEYLKWLSLENGNELVFYKKAF
jgi:hypothetical protein